jgi:hypothetical protein
MGWFHTILPTDTLMNQVMPVTHEAPITFGHVNNQTYINIHNTQISYPTAIIFLRMANIKAYFCFGRIHMNLTDLVSLLTICIM